MKKTTHFILIFFTIFYATAQKTYQPEREKINSLVHTKLKIDFNFKTKQVNGEAWLTLKPHFYNTQKVTLDAKQFTINKVKVNNKTAKYKYDKNQIVIDLNKTYKKGQEYIVYIKYIANPEKILNEGGLAISDNKGLYFINPLGTEKDKPTQIWTQGETESNSCWFPTIDTPNQKTTQEIYITVPKKYLTLSNGKLISQTNNNNNTRTDYWKMDKKHAPYLVFVGVGEFSVVKDKWQDKEVNYYVEKEYEYVAKDIFGNTPEMITFFSNLTKIPFPWNKYHQIAVRDFVSGAMENTTAVVHAEDVQQHKGQLIDENKWEGTIAHELFHHWFGNLVTTESWANLTVNESFATYSVYLWYEYKYGKDKAAAHLHKDVQSYLESQNENKKLVRFYYKDKDDMFDTVSYQKGSAILHMLRDFLGDDAFFEGLHLYLTKHKFGTAEAHQLRLALEEISGKDLNWFFNQWYFGSGHIKLNVSYDYNTITKNVTVNIKQIGKEFKFPLSIDIYEEEKKAKRHHVWVDAKDKSFTFTFNKIPRLINVDAKKVLLAEITDNKTLEQYIYQYHNAPEYLDRLYALQQVVKQQSNKQAFNTVAKALNDKYYEIRIFALKNIDLFLKNSKQPTIQEIENIARKDPKTLVRAAAIEVLGKLIDIKYKELFKQSVTHDSYAIKGSSLVALYQIDKESGAEALKTFNNQLKNSLPDAVTSIYINEKDKTELPFIANHVLKGMFLTSDKEKQKMYAQAFRWIAEGNNIEAIKNITNSFVKYGNQYRKYQFDQVAVNMLNQVLFIQQKSSNTNKEKSILIIKEGLAKLLK